MKVVLISDTHEKIAPVPSGDILIHAGDLTMMGRADKIVQAGNWLRSLPHKHKIIIAGNHDFMFERDRATALALLGPGIIYLENELVTVEGLRIYGSPVQPWFCDWAFNVHRGAPIRKFWDLIPEDLDVLITHGPPRGILDTSSLKGEHCGCDDLLMAVKWKRPKVHVFGHIHGGYGTCTIGPTTFYNAAVLDEAYNAVHAPWVVKSLGRKR